MREATRTLTREIEARRQQVARIERQGGSGNARKLLQIRSEIETLKAARQILATDRDGRREHPRRGHVDSESNVGLAIAALGDIGEPTHITNIIDRIKRIDGRTVDRQTLSSALAKLAKARNQIEAFGRATYGLLIWQKTGNPVWTVRDDSEEAAPQVIQA